MLNVSDLFLRCFCENMNKILITILSFIILCVFVFAGVFLYFESEVKKSFEGEGEKMIFEVKEGESKEEIAKSLESNGIIKNYLYFLYYILTKDRKANLKSGKYCLSSSMQISAIIKELEEGRGFKDYKSLTFPEGWKIFQIEGRLEKTGFIEMKDLENLKAGDFKKKFDFLNSAKNSFSLEGYFFPDTYFFSCKPVKISCQKEEILKCEKGDVENIASRFLSNFGEKLTSDLREEIKKQKKTIHEIITMASIIEKEVQTSKDKKVVSGIFWKRIKEGRPLESCATVAYALKEDKWTYSRAEIEKAKSPYNTYLNKGLPPGPISNPGLNSIKAAIYPAKINYNYFLTDPRTKKTIFSKTYEEHLQNRNKYFR